jgi:hypothetical protein
MVAAALVMGYPIDGPLQLAAGRLDKYKIGPPPKQDDGPN